MERRFHEEIDRVVGDRQVTSRDVPHLEYTQRIINEILRRNPPLILMRRAREPVVLAGVPIPAGTEVAASQHTLHRDPRWFPDPYRFDPDRWLPERAAALPKGAFIPFGAGARLCPGVMFAQSEIAVVAATIAAKWRLVHPKLAATMQPNRLPMTVVARR